MKIAAIADLHLGVKWGTQREMDAFEQAKEAFERAIDAGADLILILGDIFDRPVPSLEVWNSALRILSIPATKGRCRIKLESATDKPLEEISPLAFTGTPVVAIHGNHERRTKGLTNPVAALEAAGLLIHLEAGKLVFRKNGERVAIWGMSNYPDQYVKENLKTLNPKPEKGATNIFAFHQSIGQFVYSEDEKSILDISDLPRGFDIYLDGHVHCRGEAAVDGRPLLIPGSTERTQLLLAEAENPKGFYMIETGNEIKYNFVELHSPRDFFYEEVKFEDATPLEILNTARAKIQELLKRHRKNTLKSPIIKLKLLGTLAKEVSRADIDERQLIEEFSKEAIVDIRKDGLISPGLEEKLLHLRQVKERKLSIDEETIVILEDLLKDTSYREFFDLRAIYELVVEKREEEALRRILEVIEQKTLAEVGRPDDNKS
ncbi:MAG: DNA repair exonuclease [Candidatus Hadarchaeales archaeon]